jgi:His/Glu/Gln/Arg/opine family amino acid ABC transporter permease subunit
MGPTDALIAVLQGLPLTLVLTLVSFAIGMVAGIPIVLALRSRFIVVRLLMRVVVDFIRGVPIIVWLFVLKFGVVFGTFHFQPLQAAILGLGLVSAAYLAEIYRGGISAVPNGQFEAAEALGLRRRVTFFSVIVPQAFRTVSPSMATYLIGLFKDSSIASTIIVTEMVFQAQSFARENPTLVGILPYVFAGLLYIMLSLPVAALSRRMDRRLQEVS